MARMRTLVSVEMYEEKNGKIVKLDQEEYYYLLHWGLQTQVVYGKDGEPIPIVNTMAICERKEDGKIFLFSPQQIKIIGEVKNG